MAKDCKIPYKGRFYDSNKAVDGAILNNLQGKAQLPSMDMGQASSVLKEMRHTVRMMEGHKYYHGSNEYQSATTFIKKIVPPFYGKAAPEGELSRRVGTDCHGIAEAVIANRSKGLSHDSDDLLDYVLEEDEGDRNVKDIVANQPLYEKMVTWANEFYDKLAAEGTVIPEFRIAHTKKGIKGFHGVAGTVDVAVVHGDGSVTLYDFKGTRHEYGEFENKLKSNNMQLHTYSRIMEMGDEDTGLPQFTVRDAYVVPIMNDIDSVYDRETKSRVPVLMDVSPQNPININDENTFPFTKAYKQIAKSEFSVDREGVKITQATKVDFGSVVSNLTGHESTSKTDLELAESIANKAILNKNGVYQYTNANRRRVNFENEVARTDRGPDGHQARINEILKEDIPNRIDNNNGLAIKLVSAFNTGSDPMGDDVYLRSKMDSLFGSYTRKVDHMVLANTIEGFENLGDDVIIVFKNYQDGRNMNDVDIITTSYNKNNAIEKHQGSNQRSNIFGKSMKNNAFKAIRDANNLAGMKILNNTQSDNEALTMGMMAIALKNSNSNLTIGDIRSIEFKKNGVDFIYEMNTILDNIKIAKEAKLTDSLDDNLSKLLDKTTLMDADVYEQNFTKSLFNYIMGGVLNLNSESYLTGLMDKNKIAEEQKEWDKRFGPKSVNWLSKNELKFESSEDIDEFVKALKANSTKRTELLQVLGRRLEFMLEGKKDADLIQTYHNSEVKLLMRSIMQLQGTSSNMNNVFDATTIETMTSVAGMTGIPIVDSFFNLVSEKHIHLAKKLSKNYVKDKKVKFGNLFGNKVVDNVLGDHTKYFHPLLEKIHFDKNGRTVTRFSGRLIAEDSAAFKELTQEQQKFITWFNDQVEASFKLRGLKWKRGYVPIVKSKVSNMLFKRVDAALKGEEGGFDGLAKAVWKRKTSVFASRMDEGDMDVGGTKTDMDGIEDQFMFQGIKDDESESQYGIHESSFEEVRNNQMGYDAEGNLYGDDDIDYFESDLEKVLDMLVITGEISNTFSELIPAQAAMNGLLTVAQTQTNTSSDTKSLGVVQDYVRVMGDAALNQRTQLTFQSAGMEAGVRAFLSFTSSRAIRFNIFSQTKTMMSGYVLNSSNIAAKAFSGDWDSAKAYATAMKEAMRLFDLSKPDDANKIHSILWQNGLADVDVEDFKRDLKYKAGGNNIASARWGYGLQHAGDYYHRAVISIANMINDGVWDAYDKTVGEDGSVEWVYNEDKDLRWKGESKSKRYHNADGTKYSSEDLLIIKDEIISRLAATGELTDDGRMTVPYSNKEVARIKAEQDLTFEHNTMQNRAAWQNYAFFKLLSQMGGWMISKGNMYWKKGHVNEKLKGKWVVKTDSDGNKYAKWEGEYIEGVLQTIWGYHSAFESLLRGNPKALSEKWSKMSTHQKENVGRMMHDAIFTSVIMLAVSSLFDDDEKDTVYYYWIMNLLGEANFMNYAQAFGSAVVNPFPSVAVMQSILRKLFSFDPEKTVEGTLTALGPTRILSDINRIIRDTEVMLE